MNDLSKRNLVAEAEALEVRACDHESAAKNLTVSAERCRAEAAKLREQAREPLRLWMLIGANGDWLGTYDSEGAAMAVAAAGNGRRVVPMVEVRPVRITDEQVAEASAKYRIASGWYSYSSDGIRAVMEYALSLVGVEVEK